MVLFATFADDGAPSAPPSWADELFDVTRPGSVSHFWDDMSFGLLQVEGEVGAPQVFVSSQPASAYIAVEPTRNGDFGRFAREILAAADEVVDFSRYDGDRNGLVDAVFIVLPSVPANFLRGPATGMAWLGIGFPYETDDRVDGRRVRIDPFDGTLQQGSSFAETAATICHEFGHVLGLPDLWNTEFLTTLPPPPVRIRLALAPGV
ncbi:hypothetical protein ACFL6X_00315 [Candidatus Latescibacterota bacterium]